MWLRLTNQWTGKCSFGDRCLHTIDPTRNVLNPYQVSIVLNACLTPSDPTTIILQNVITIIGRTLEPFDKKHLIPVFGFGDATTADRSIFSFHPDGRPCRGLREVLKRYDELTPQLALGGPTNFAPIIYEAIRRVKATNSYHILVIIAGKGSKIDTLWGLCNH